MKFRLLALLAFLSPLSAAEAPATLLSQPDKELVADALTKEAAAAASEKADAAVEAVKEGAANAADEAAKAAEAAKAKRPRVPSHIVPPRPRAASGAVPNKSAPAISAEPVSLRMVNIIASLFSSGARPSSTEQSPNMTAPPFPSAYRRHLAPAPQHRSGNVDLALPRHAAIAAS